ncbi:hypothetical protein EDB81DRAFT_777079 [Dactylonectria macrodidyma]|uniref:Uncharacterized protein n=1 Tax=Dactylonectria macrodidyma TaxID=307937 RepID=A0A9P9FQI4_9HYPO|nr:hypothetical protein EDB81DRAFT_777079 [Dactylonectria macrodidyma]
MRFTVAAVAGFAALASAATTTASIDAAQASYIACLDDCPTGDVKCQSYCVVVPSPNDAQANATNNCVGECDQGDGSESDTQKYAKCVQSCISDNYFLTSSGTPLQTGSSDSSDDDDDSSAAASATGSSDNTASAAATASGSGSSATGASETNSDASSGTGTATGSSASSTETDSGATLAIGSVSVFALFAAVLAL